MIENCLFQILSSSEDGRGILLLVICLIGMGVFIALALFLFLSTRNIINDDMEEMIEKDESSENEISDTLDIDREKTVFLIEVVNNPVITRREIIECEHSFGEMNLNLDKNSPSPKSQIVQIMLRIKKLWESQCIGNSS